MMCNCNAKKHHCTYNRTKIVDSSDLYYWSSNVHALSRNVKKKKCLGCIIQKASINVGRIALNAGCL